MSKNKENKYLLQKSKEKPNHWVFTDEENLISIIFENRKFDETEEVKLLQDFDPLKVSELAKIIKEMGDYLRNNHYDILFPISPTDNIKKILDELGMSAVKASEVIGLSYNTFRNYLNTYLFKEDHVKKLEKFIHEFSEKIKKGDYYGDVKKN